MVIGDLVIDPPVLLAPMAGVSNRAFRGIVRQQGAGLCMTEMVNANALLHQSAKSYWLMELDPDEYPVGIQLAGSDPKIMAQAAKDAARHNAQVIDINMGCPVAKVVKNGDGSALLRDIDQAVAVAAAVVDAVEVPVTVKMRAGWDHDWITAPELAEKLEAVGVKALSVHARTRSDQYMRPANWLYIKMVKQRVSIPVIGNGDVAGPEDAQRMLTETGCDGVMIGRASFGDPWIFRRVAHFLRTGQPMAPPTAEERSELARQHLDRLVAIKSERMAIPEMRRQLAWYLKGTAQSSQYRARCHQIATRRAAHELIDAWLDHARREAPSWN